jgi:TRAP-type C4-dicarboxylate transport system permease small subunit
MIEFLSGALTMGYLVSAGFFMRFWRATADRLFLAFALAFLLLALNQALAQWLGAADERLGYTYLLRVLGFVLILAAIIDKNLSQNGKRRARRSA